MQVYTSWTLPMPQLELRTPPSPRLLCRSSCLVLVHTTYVILLAGPGRDAHLAQLQPERGDLPARPDLQLPLGRGRRGRHRAERAEGRRGGAGRGAAPRLLLGVNLGVIFVPTLLINTDDDDCVAAAGATTWVRSSIRLKFFLCWR